MGNLLNTCAPIPPNPCTSSPKTISQQYNASHCAASSQEVNLNLTISTVSHQEEISPHRHESASDGVEGDTEASPENEPETQANADANSQQVSEPGSQLQTQLQTQTQTQTQPETETETEQEHQAESESRSQQPKDVVAARPVLKSAIVDVSKHRVSYYVLESRPWNGTLALGSY